MEVGYTSAIHKQIEDGCIIVLTFYRSAIPVGFFFLGVLEFPAVPLMRLELTAQLARTHTHNVYSVFH